MEEIVIGNVDIEDKVNNTSNKLKYQINILYLNNIIYYIEKN